MVVPVPAPTPRTDRVNQAQAVWSRRSPSSQDWLHEADQVDAVFTLMAALEGAERQPVETRLVGWL
jgi:hypothetical protein